MTRFAFITDTHFGANPMGYQQQEGVPEGLLSIVGALVKRLEGMGGVDFIVHGGDLVDFTSENTIQGGAALFDLPYPVYLCLGNHDLTTADALDSWLRLAPEFFPDGAPNFTIETDDCVLHVVPNQWCEAPYRWDGEQSPHFLPEQLACLRGNLARKTDIPHVIVTHNAVFGLPPGQTGKSEPLHSPPAQFTQTVTALVGEYPHVKCVLGGHNHMNMGFVRNGVGYATASALVEVPFEFKLITVEGGCVTMETISLGDQLGMDVLYDASKRYVQGRDVDRSWTVSD